jgi:hypothetical protein
MMIIMIIISDGGAGASADVRTLASGRGFRAFVIASPFTTKLFSLSLSLSLSLSKPLNFFLNGQEITDHRLPATMTATWQNRPANLRISPLSLAEAQMTTVYSQLSHRPVSWFPKRSPELLLGLSFFFFWGLTPGFNLTGLTSPNYDSHTQWLVGERRIFF